MSESGLTLGYVMDLLQAEILSGDDFLNRLVTKFSATNFMSAVLAFSQPGALLLTGLVNIQVVNTAEVAALGGVVFVGGVRPPLAVINKAKGLDLPTFLTPSTLDDASQALAKLGMPAI